MADIRDITPKERELLSFIRSCPGLALGKGADLAGMEALVFGYTAALRNADANDSNVLVPDGLNDYLTKKYLGKSALKQPIGLFNVIRMQEKDERKALALFFELLDEYLVSLGFEPLPIYKKLF